MKPVRAFCAALALMAGAQQAAIGAPPPAAQAQSALFLVHFKPDHPIGRAQRLAAQGRLTQARKAAIAALRRSPRLKGLCFVRFTLGGAETVLQPCVSPAPGERQAANAKVLARLRANPLIDYADASVAVDVNAKQR